MNQKPGFKKPFIFVPVWVKSSILDTLLPQSIQIWTQNFIGANLLKQMTNKTNIMTRTYIHAHISFVTCRALAGGQDCFRFILCIKRFNFPFPVLLPSPSLAKSLCWFLLLHSQILQKGIQLFFFFFFLFGSKNLKVFCFTFFPMFINQIKQLKNWCKQMASKVPLCIL